MHACSRSLRCHALTGLTLLAVMGCGGGDATGDAGTGTPDAAVSYPMTTCPVLVASIQRRNVAGLISAWEGGFCDRGEPTSPRFVRLEDCGLTSEAAGCLSINPPPAGPNDARYTGCAGATFYTYTMATLQAAAPTALNGCAHP